MKQNLRYSLLMLLLAVFNLGVFAADETIDFSKQGYSNGDEISSVSLPNCTITFNKGTGINAPKYYNNGTAIRVYGGNYFTVSSSTKTIEKIELTFGTDDGTNAITTDVATYSKGTWTGSAQSVKFTVGGTSGNRRLASVAVTYANSKIDIATLNSITPTEVFVGDLGEFTLDATFAEGTVGDKDYEVSWESSDADVLEVAGNIYEAKAAGTVQVTVSVTVLDDETYNTYNGVSRSFTVTVSKKDSGIAYQEEECEAVLGEDNSFPSLTNIHELLVNYSSSNEKVATIDKDGEVTLLAAGWTTITATTEETDEYLAGETSYVLTVTDPNAPVIKYELVTDASTLAYGDEIVIAYVKVKADGTTVKVLGTTQNTNNRAAVNAELKDDGTLTIGADAQVINLTEDGDWFKFDVKDGYLYAAGGTSNNYLRTTKDATDTKAQATISIDSYGDATINFNLTGNSPHNQMRYNTSSKMFACYASNASTSNMPMPQIYRRVQDAPQTVTITIGEHGYASYCGDKNLDFSATELKAYAVTQVENGVMILTEFEDGYKAGEGAVLKGAKGTYQVPVATTATAVAGNMLIGNNSDAAITVEADGITYRFGYSPAAQKVGFMKATSNFTVASGKAYLKINSTNNAPAFLSFDGTATGIDAANVSTTAADGQRYNLAGQRVNSNYRGVVIVDGKKLIQK